MKPSTIDDVIRYVCESGHFTLVREIKSKGLEKSPGVVKGYLMEALKNNRISDEFAVKFLVMYRLVYYCVHGFISRSSCAYADTLAEAFKYIKDIEWHYGVVSFPKLKEKLVLSMCECMETTEIILLILSYNLEHVWEREFYKPIIRKLCENLHSPDECDRFLLKVCNNLDEIRRYKYELHWEAFQMVSMARVKCSRPEVLREEAFARIPVTEKVLTPA